MTRRGRAPDASHFAEELATLFRVHRPADLLGNLVATIRGGFN